jgi:hypothetical protein
MGAAGADYNSARGNEQVTFLINDQVKSQRMMFCRSSFLLLFLLPHQQYDMIGIDIDSGASSKGLQRS